MQTVERSVPRRVIVVLALAVTAVGSAGVLVRLAEGVHPLVVAFWRTLAVALIFLPLLRRPGPRELGLALAAGGLLALHFWTWFASLAHISVLRSTVLVCLTPIWSGLLERVLYGQRASARFWVGIALAIAGVVVMAGGELGAGSARGDLLALAGGWLASAYFVIGRGVRQRVDMGTWGALLCGSAALWLLGLALLVGAPLTGFPRQSWLALLGLALGPQLIGHMGFNYAVRYVPAAFIGAVVLLEPVLGALLAAAVLGERPGAQEMLGAALVLAGVAFAVWRPRPAGPQ